MKRKKNQHPLFLHFMKFKGGGGDVPQPVKPDPVAPPSAPVKATSQDVQVAKKEEKARDKDRRGYSSTIATGQQGLSGEQANTKRKTLLGGGS
ncbi:MAG: hypothetical protein JXR78_15240 [Victivallales bacterium]|nr:hypothetical protein [Victivallales bacterium]